MVFCLQAQCLPTVDESVFKYSAMVVMLEIFHLLPLSKVLSPLFTLIWVFHLFSVRKTDDDMIVNILKIERFCMKINMDCQILMSN